MDLKSSLESLLWYRTVKVVQIRSWKLGIVHYSVQLVIVAYIIGWVLIYKKGYQLTDTSIGEASIKIKGNAYHNNNNNTQIWDSYDVVYPPMEQNAFFLTTNFWSTYGQQRGICEGTLNCTNNPCPHLKSSGDGVTTGTCTNGTCDIYAWCPTENEPKVTTNYLGGIDKFTAFIKVNVKFPVLGYQRSNVNGSVLTDNYNLFTLSRLLDLAKTDLDDVKQQGAIIMFSVDFNCDFDKSGDSCIPTFKAERIDSAAPVSKGFNFRWVSYYWLPDEVTGEKVQYRDLMKVYGIRFIILISGTGGKFNFVPLALNLGSGLALLSVATVVSDFIALHIHPQRNHYQHSKFEDINEEEQVDERTALVSNRTHVNTATSNT